MEIYKNEHWSIDQHTPVDGEFFLVMKQGRIFAKVFNKDDAMLIVNNVPINNYMQDQITPPEGMRLMTQEENQKIIDFNSLNRNKNPNEDTGIYLYSTPKQWVSDALGICKLSPFTYYAVPLDFNVDEYLKTWK